VDHVGKKLLQALAHDPPRAYRQPDLRIAGTRDRGLALGADDFNRVAQSLRGFRGFPQRGDDTIDLRSPGI
jgi:hypothetical protein